MGDGGAHATDWTPGGALHTGYVVQHYLKLDGHDIPSGYWVYLRPVSGGGGYKIHLSGPGHAGQIRALTGSEHPRQLRVAESTAYAAVWSDVELPDEAIERELGRSESRVTPSAEDAAHHQLKVPAASEYAVLHLRRTGGTDDIPSGSWVYLRSVGSTQGYKAHLDSAGHASQIESLSGSEHPASLRVAQRSTYEATWAPSELTGPSLEHALSAAGSRVTPAAADATAQRLVVTLASEYVVLHFKQRDGTHDVPQGYVYLKPAAGGTGYEIHLGSGGRVSQIAALSGSDHPTDVRVRIGTVYSAFWCTVQLQGAARDDAFADASFHITPVEDDGQHQQLKVPVGPLVLTSTTFAESPANRQRLKLAVGEKVSLQVQNLQGTEALSWTGGGYFPRTTGHPVDWYAPPQPANPVTVTVTQGTRTASLRFEVVAPSLTKLAIVAYHPQPGEDFRRFREHTEGECDCGFHARTHMMPDDVNFYATEFLELEDLAAGTGVYFLPPEDRGHHPSGPLPLVNTGVPPAIVPGLGTPGNLIDHIYSGHNYRPPQASNITLHIPHQYRVTGPANGPAAPPFERYCEVIQIHTVEIIDLGPDLTPMVSLHAEKCGVSPPDISPQDPDAPAH